jgi:hypothetical protein
VIELTPARAAARGELRTLLLACAAVCAMGGAAQAHAPTPAAAPASPDDVDAVVEELVVVAETREQPGAVIGDIPPEIQLGQREIRALGVSSVTELLDALAPQIGSARGRGSGRPVMLVNGQRISSFAEIRDLPTEAILRVDILPEEVALKYGYRADQRVVNLVLRPRFRAITTEAAATLPTAGGREGYDVTASALRIQRESRLQVNLKASRTTPLLESERDVLRDPRETPRDASGRTADEAPYRSLASAQDAASLNLVYTRPIGEGIGLTLNGLLESTQTESRLGLPGFRLTAPPGLVSVPRVVGLEPLTRTGDTLNGHLGAAANGAVRGWRWSATTNLDRTETHTLTDGGIIPDALQAAVDRGALDPYGALPPGPLLYRAPDQAKSVATGADAELLVNGQAFDLPAGRVNMAFTVGAEHQGLESKSFRGGTGVRTYADLSRDIGRAKANIDVPLTRRGQFLGAVGDLSVNVNAEAETLSDFGTLTSIGGGLNWSPVDRLRVIASFTREEGAPSMAQLGNPELTTPNVRVFDYRTGQTVEVTRTEGGNAALSADEREVIKLGLNWKPLKEQDLSFRADYTRSRIEDVIASFPAATAEIQAAFPERFTRDAASGRLTAVDVRPVNFDRRESEQIRWGFNYSRPLRATRQPQLTPEEQRRFAERRARFLAQQGEGAPAQSPASAGGAAAPAPGGADAPARPEGPRPEGGRRAGGGGPGGFGGGFGPGGGGFRGRGGGPGAGALQFAVFHTWHLQEEIFIRPGVAPLDLLDGSAIGNSGGQPRHEVEAQAGFSRNGLGARAVVRWQSGTEVNGARFGGQQLKFSDLTTVNLRLFADLGLQPIAKGRPWLRGARATLSVDNLFDARQDVRDAEGLTPINYQPDLIDPVGRTVRISFRKLFF